MILTNEIIKSSFFCSFKTFLKIEGHVGKITDFEKMEMEIKEELISRYILINENSNNIICSNIRLSYKNNFDFNLAINVSSFSNFHTLTFDAIERDGDNLIPIYFSPNSTVAKYEKEYISCLAFILNSEFSTGIKISKIIYEKDSRLITQKVNMSVYQTSVKKRLTDIKRFADPEFCLNKNCIFCEYKDRCLQKAQNENHLSLLSKVTPKVIDKYKKKGIFTVNQLSYLYKPRRRKKKDTPLVHNIELQALAIRTGKTYVKAMEQISRSDIEFFIDIESVPKFDLYYLFGIVLRKKGELKYYPFWVDTNENQNEIFEDFLNLLEKFPNSVIYHYGNFEVKALTYLSNKFDRNIDAIIKRFVNANSFLHGKIYFPIYSNSLKHIGQFLGIQWKVSNASGLQSIVWRYYWGKGYYDKKEILKDYNKTDCIALVSLLDKLYEIMQYEDSNSISEEFDFIDNINKQTTKRGKDLHNGLEVILKIAHENYDAKRMSVHNLNTIFQSKTKEKKPRKGLTRKTCKARKVVRVKRKLICPTHKTRLQETTKESQWTITEMVFTRSAMRKQVICFKGFKSYCPNCLKYFKPPKIEQIQGKNFGHGIQSWIVYQRLYLRLPYSIIKTNLAELFNENISPATISNTLKYFSKYYQFTEQKNLTSILNSPFIHADETKLTF